MKKIYTFIFIFAALCLFSANKAMAIQHPATFSVPNADGKLIYYYQIPETNTVEVTFDGADWNVADRTYYSGDLVIPSTVTHNGVDYTVIGIGDVAFAISEGKDQPEDKLLTSITLPNTCQYIGHDATICFFWQRKLKEIVIPDNVTYIDNAAFRHCSGLESITIGAGITDLTSNDGIFNLALGSDGDVDVCKVRKVTVRAIEPPKVDWKTFLGVDMPNIFLLVPPESLDAYKNHTEVSEWFTGWSFFGNIYPIGTFLPPLKFEATSSGLLTWTGDAPAYDLIISTTELDEAALAAYPAGNMIRVTETEYGAELDAEEGANYVYVRSDYGDGKSAWVSASFFFYTGTYCEYTVSGQDLYYLLDPEDNYEDPMPWGWDGSAHLEFWQAGFLIATVGGDAAFAEGGATVSLVPGFPATLEWKGDGTENDFSSLLLTDGSGNTILSRDDLESGVPATLGPIEINCSGSGVKKPIVSDVSITSTLSKGFVTVTAAAGSVAKVTDLTGRTLKSETITGANQKVELNYANGVYLILLEKGNSRFVQKVILRR